MSTVVASMQQVPPLRFAPAHNALPAAEGDASAGQNVAVVGEGQVSDEQLDFDLLAEYLLDDGSNSTLFPAIGGGASTDQGSGKPADSGSDYYAVATASQADPLADAHAQLAAGAKGKDGQGTDIASDLAQVQQMIATHTGRAQDSTSTQPTSQVPQQAQAPAGQVLAQPPVQPQLQTQTQVQQQQVQVQVQVAQPVQQQVQAPQQPIQQQVQVQPQTQVQQPQVQVQAQPQATPAPLTHPGMAFAMQTSQTQPSPAPAPLPAMVVHQHAAAPAAPAPAAMASVTAGPTDSLSGVKRPMQLPMDVQGQRRQKTQAQINRRRERNRILARRTRLRKKFFFESLQKEVTDLQRENNALKEIIKRKLDQSAASKVLEECAVELPSIVMESCGDATELDRQDYSLIKSLQGSQQSFVITDPSLQDNPIVYASEGFLSLTGYSRDEVLGRNCRFLQGTDSSPAKVETIRKGLAAGEDVSVCLVNYTADGTMFWNQLFIAALRDANNNIVNFVGVLVRVSGPSPDDPEYGKTLGSGGAESSEGAGQGETGMTDGAVDEITNAVSAAVDAAPNF